MQRKVTNPKDQIAEDGHLRDVSRRCKLFRKRIALREGGGG
jgi:hypothetical protein